MSSGATAGAVPAAAETPNAGGNAMSVGITESKEVGGDQFCIAAVCWALAAGLAAACLTTRLVTVFGADGCLVVAGGLDWVGPLLVGGAVVGSVEVTCFTVWSRVVTTLSGDGTPGTDGTEGTDGTGGTGGSPVSANATPPDSRQRASAPVETPTARRVTAVDVMWPSLRLAPVHLQRPRSPLVTSYPQDHRPNFGGQIGQPERELAAGLREGRRAGAGPGASGGTPPAPAPRPGAGGGPPPPRPPPPRGWRGCR